MRELRTLFEETMGRPPDDWEASLATAVAQGEPPGCTTVPPGSDPWGLIPAWLAGTAAAMRANRAAGRSAEGVPVRSTLGWVVPNGAVGDAAGHTARRMQAALAKPACAKIRTDLGDPAGLYVRTRWEDRADEHDWLLAGDAPCVFVGTADEIGSALLFGAEWMPAGLRAWAAGRLGTGTHFVFENATDSLRTRRVRLLVDAVGRMADPRVPPDGWKGRTGDPICSTAVEAPGNLTGATSGKAGGDAPAGSPPARRIGIAEADRKDLARAMTTAVRSALARLDEEPDGGDCLACCTNAKLAARIAGMATKGRGKAAGRTIVMATGGQRGIEARETAEAIEQLADRERKAGEPAGLIVATDEALPGIRARVGALVCDLAGWEETTERIASASRSGSREVEITVVTTDVDPKATVRGTEAHARRLLLTRALAEMEAGADAAASSTVPLRDPRKVAQKHEAETITDKPRQPPGPTLDAATLESWTLTSLRRRRGDERAPWVRGWTEETMTTRIAWRRTTPVVATREDRRTARAAGRNTGPDTNAFGTRKTTRFLEAAPIDPAETLEATSEETADWLRARAEKTLAEIGEQASDGAESRTTMRPDTPVVWILDTPSTISSARQQEGHRRAWTLQDAARLDGRIATTILADRTILVDARLGGLAAGRLDTGENARVGTLDAPGRPREAPAPSWRVREVRSRQAGGQDGWAECFRATSQQVGRDAIRWLIVETAGRPLGCRAIEMLGSPMTTAALHDAAGREARTMRMPGGALEAVEKAALACADGRADREWQRAHGAAGETPMGITAGPLDRPAADRLAHEIDGFLGTRGDTGPVDGETTNERELALHLITALHHEGRPGIGLGHASRPPSRMAGLSREAAGRFLALQRAYGPWGLARLEAAVKIAAARPRGPAGGTTQASAKRSTP